MFLGDLHSKRNSVVHLYYEDEIIIEAIYRCCAGADLHSKTVAVCVRRVDEAGKVHKEIRTFGTMTRDLLGLSDWLLAEGVTHLAMESTGVFWTPIYNILEGQFEIVLVNARHVKNVPGRKTDVKDCEWLAQLLRCGLLRGSFIPALPQRELRDLTRMRKQLTHEMSAVANRIHKMLEDSNIKLGLLATDILGVSGRRMLAALIDGETDVDKMADLACRRLRDKIPLLRLALHGKVTEHHRFMLKPLMDHLCCLEREIEQFSKQIEVASRPFNKAITALIPIPGIDLERDRRDRSEYEAVSHRRSPCLLGEDLPRKQRKRRQTKERNNWERGIVG